MGEVLEFKGLIQLFMETFAIKPKLKHSDRIYLRFIASCIQYPKYPSNMYTEATNQE